MKVSEKLGLGTVQFGLAYGISNKDGQTTSLEVSKILKTAQSFGIDVLDSASAYGNSEDILGKNELSSFKMVSKFMPSGFKPIGDQLETSLRNLGLKKLHGYLAHRPMDILENPSEWDNLLKFKSTSKVDKIGFSLNEPWELEKLIEKGYNPDIVQIPYNYFDRRFESLIIELKGKGCEIHSRSTFLQGLFFLSENELPDFFQEVKPLIKDLQQNNLLNGALLKYVLDKKFIDKTIIGVENNRQLIENVENVNLAPTLPELQLEISDNILIPSRWPK
jgi:aryl-alcohol dehydrogenase-like predicted oxidoreductase